MEIKADIICDSVSSVDGVRLTTFVLEYPRIIHAELLTHRMLSKNSASSRAIPFNKMKEQLTGRPVRFGEANPGMQDKGVDFGAKVMGSWGQAPVPPELAWQDYTDQACLAAHAFYKAGYHKQVYNRLTEPFQMMRVLISGTDWENFFWLRNDVAADPTLHALAAKMEEAYRNGTPRTLQPGQWHLPFVKTWVLDNVVNYLIEVNGEEFGDALINLTLEEAQKVSAARCAAVSFRNTDYSLEKCLEVYERLVGDERKHASAFEHQATPMKKVVDYEGWWSSENHPPLPATWQEGITHADRKGVLWSGNFRGFIQYRQLIPGHNKESY